MDVCKDGLSRPGQAAGCHACVWGSPSSGAHQASRGISTRSGFTLIEVLLATAIVVMGLGAITVTVSTALRIAAGTSNMMGAMHAAREQAERLATNRFSASTLEVGRHEINLPGQEAFYIVSDAGARRKDVQVVVAYFNPAKEGASEVEVVTRLVEALQQ